MKYSLISKYRTALMGFATIWIAFLHAQMWFRFPLLQAFKRTGHAGVDIFLFLSSFGMYYAYQKHEPTVEFIKRRMMRIIPYFLPVALLRCYTDHGLAPYPSFLTITTLNFWIGWDRSMWFISGIIVLYLITPLYLSFFNKGQQELKTICICTISLIGSFLLRKTRYFIFLARLAVFFLGFLAGKFSYDDKEVSSAEYKLIILAVLSGLFLYAVGFYMDTNDNYLYGLGLYWYPNFFLAWPLCLYMSKGLSKLDNENVIIKVLNSFGKISLSYYLLHELLVRYLGQLIELPQPFGYNWILENILIMLIAYVVATIYQNTIDFVIKKKSD